ncbi:MAG: phosphotransferase family protein [Actinobacteria bacterium]|nr:phosphotransferase family protein [Actinomycetota bacterium]
MSAVAVDPDALGAFLADRGLAAARPGVEEIGGGHSNLTFLLRFEDREDLVLRRPPLGPLAPSANDVLREARLLEAIRHLGVPVPEVVGTCEDPDVIGAPFYLMRFIDGAVLGTSLPPAYGGDAGEPVAVALVEALVRVHRVDAGEPRLAGFGRPEGYLERQLRRFRSLLEANATRPLADLEAVADWLDDNCPPERPATLVHGDFRLGNLIFDRARPRLRAILDWEMGTIGDPLADLGYCTAMWAQADDAPNPMLDLSALTRGPGFPGRRRLVELYAERSGRDVSGLTWYQVLALWKAAIFLEGSYGRFLAGKSDDRYFARLGEGVPALGAQALRLTRGG